MDDYYAALFDWDPTQATAAGIHDRDDKLADLSAAAVANAGPTASRSSPPGSPSCRSGKLTEADAIDAEVLDHAIRAELLDLETVRDWKRNPMLYLGTAGRGASTCS